MEVSKEELYMQRAHSGKNRWPRRGLGAREMAESDDMGSWPLYPRWGVAKETLFLQEPSLAWRMWTPGGGASSSPAVTEALDLSSLPCCGSAGVLLTFSWSLGCWASTPHPSPSLWWSHIRLC